MEDKLSGTFSKNYLPLFGNLNVTDVTEDNNLWNILSRH